MFSREEIRIENARHYPRETVEQLRTALPHGAVLRADESRMNFYDLDTEGRTFFIYVSPATGNVTLIATWDKNYSSTDTESDGQAPWWRRFTAHFLSA